MHGTCGFVVCVRVRVRVCACALCTRSIELHLTTMAAAAASTSLAGARPRQLALVLEALAKVAPVRLAAKWCVCVWGAWVGAHVVCARVCLCGGACVCVRA